ncbi:MAG: HAD family phosphatase [Acidobacteriota bacterium]|nr:HAD family phosphatase [Acidobacteriota bacterium]
MVLTGPPLAEAHTALIARTGLTAQRFEEYYWVHRHAYDEGKLTGLQFWEKFLSEAQLPAELAAELNELDARMWTTQNPAMLDWQLALKQRGMRTAILSNMGDSVLAQMQATFDWLSRFDVLIWSYQHRMAKPDHAIYHHTLAELGTQPNETLFIDDKAVNIEAARDLGLHAIQFSTVAQLRADLIAKRLDKELPLPA